MKILVILLLCSCVFGVPLGQEEAALAELLQKVLEADPGENDIVIDKAPKQDTSTSVDNVLEKENNVVVNSTTELPTVDKVDSASNTIEEPNSEKPLELIGEIILDPIPEEDAIENESATEIPEGTKALTGTLIVDEMNDESDGEMDSLKVPNDEQTEVPLSYDRLNTPFRIPLTRDGLGWINKPSDRFKLFKPFNRDYDNHFTMLENPFSSPLDMLPMNPEFFESTTSTDYEAPSQDYPLYDNVYDDDQTLKVTSNDSDVENLDQKIPNDLEIPPAENEDIPDPNADILSNENDQTNMEDPSVLPINENPNADIFEQPQSTDNDYPPASDTDVVSSSDTDSAVPFYPDRYENDMKGDFNYENDQIQNYPLDNRPNFERTYPPYSSGNDMENERDFTRFNSRGPFYPHYYDSYDKYINVGDIKNFSPYMFYPKRYDGYDLFFRPQPQFERLSREKMIITDPVEVMEPQRDVEVPYEDNSESINNEGLPDGNMEDHIDETNVDTDNNMEDHVDETNVNTDSNNVDGYVNNENTDTVNEPYDTPLSEQETSQDTYNEFYDNKPEWSSPHSVLNTDFSPMAQASPVETNNPMMEVPHYYFNGYPYYGNQYMKHKRDNSMYLFNGLVRGIGDDSRFRRIHQYRNNPYNRNDGPIIVFVGPTPNQNDEGTLNTNQVDTESEDQYINNDGTLLTDVNHNLDIPYSPGYHPAFYTDRGLYPNKGNNIDGEIYEDTQSFSPVDMPIHNHPYNSMIGYHPFPSNDFDYFRKYYKRNLYNNRRDYRNADYYEELYKPNRYYRREPREFLNDYAYY